MRLLLAPFLEHADAGGGATGVGVAAGVEDLVVEFAVEGGELDRHHFGHVGFEGRGDLEGHNRNSRGGGNFQMGRCFGGGGLTSGEMAE